jgi:hypothetical protein
VKSVSRAHVASSFTILKGALIEESYSYLADWDSTRSREDNLSSWKDRNPIGARSNAWLRDVAFVMSRRFDPNGKDRPLQVLARGGLPLDEWKPILLWHITRDEFILRDFLINWLFPSFVDGVYQMRAENVYVHLKTIGRRGATLGKEWSETTVDRVAHALLVIAKDFGFLVGSAAKEFTSYHLPERSFMYLLHVLRECNPNPNKILTAEDWRMFLMRPDDIEQELLRLHQFRKLHYEAAGSIVQLTLPSASAREYAERMVA